jgi:hypothetical protein
MPFDIITRRGQYLVVTQGQPSHVHGRFPKTPAGLRGAKRQLSALYANVPDARKGYVADKKAKHGK